MDANRLEQDVYSAAFVLPYIELREISMQILLLLVIIVLIAPWTLLIIIPAYAGFLIISGIVVAVVVVALAVHSYLTREKSPEAVARRAQKIAEEANRRNAQR